MPKTATLTSELSAMSARLEAVEQKLDIIIQLLQRAQEKETRKARISHWSPE